LGFGLVSGIITTLGLLVGLYSTLPSKLVVIGGILSIAVADAFSDALGSHMSEEYSQKKSSTYIWSITFSTFISKLFFASLFLIPILLFELKVAVLISVIFGFLMIIFFSYKISIDQKENVYSVIIEHTTITLIVVILTYYVGYFISLWFS